MRYVWCTAQGYDTSCFDMKQIKIPKQDKTLESLKNAVKMLVVKDAVIRHAFGNLIDELNNHSQMQLPEPLNKDQVLEMYCLQLLLRPMNDALFPNGMELHWMTQSFERLSKKIREADNPIRLV